MAAPSMDDPRFIAAADLIGRTGARQLQVRWSDDEEPTVWFCVASYHGAHEAAAAMHPLTAILRLIDRLVDGGQCARCGRASGVSDEWEVEQPIPKLVCWYVFDPELKKYRRSCEGDTAFDAMMASVGRNDPCPCGSGEKYKRCHGGRA